MFDEFSTGHWFASTQRRQCDVIGRATGETEWRRELQKVMGGYGSCPPSLTHCVMELSLWPNREIAPINIQSMAGPVQDIMMEQATHA